MGSERYRLSSILTEKRRSAISSTGSHSVQRHTSVKIDTLNYSSTKRKDRFLDPSETRCISHHEEQCRHLAEWFLPKIRRQARSRISTTHGWTLRVLPPSMVVQISNVLSFQTLSRFPERFGLASHGLECRCRCCVEGQSSHDRINCLWNRRQKMERIQELFH